MEDSSDFTKRGDVVITIQDVEKIYGEKSSEPFKALSSINLVIDDGECVVLSGVSGSGKSTLLSIIAALDRPTSGRVVVDGELISKLPDLHASAYRAKSVGFIFQHFNLLESLSVEENIMASLINADIDMRRAKEMTQRAMREASIEHKASQTIRELSGGEKQRCAIARALVREPKYIICDEPTANLDRDNSLKFIDIIERLHRDGKSIIIATHDPLFEDLRFESRVVHMQDGTIANGE